MIQAIEHVWAPKADLFQEKIDRALKSLQDRGLEVIEVQHEVIWRVSDPLYSAILVGQRANAS